jgi:hypothetical protein
MRHRRKDQTFEAIDQRNVVLIKQPLPLFEMAWEERVFGRRSDLWRGFETLKREPHECSSISKEMDVGFGKAKAREGSENKP